MSNDETNRSGLRIVPQPLDHRLPPEGAERQLLSMFDVTIAGANEALIDGKLLAGLIAIHGSAISKTDFSTMISRFVAEGWIEPTPCPEPIKLPSLPDLPGLRKLVIHDPRAARPGDRCFRATSVGAKMARLCRDIVGNTGLWRLGIGSEREQVILALDADLWTRFRIIDATCSRSASDDVRHALDTCVADGLVERQDDRYRLTRTGLHRHAEIHLLYRRLRISASPTVQSGPLSPRTRIFISFASSDADALNEILAHVSPLRKAGLVDIWHRHMVPIGADRAAAIMDQLEQAELVALLVTANFISSDECYEFELNRALLRSREANGCTVIPIIIAHCDWETTSFAHLQFLPRNKRPIDNWARRDEAWTEVVKELRTCIASIASRRAAPGPPADGPPEQPPDADG